jgi:CRP-like cAMP-binding protein
MHIREQRAEKPNLERLVCRMLAGGGDVDSEKAAIRSLWRTATHSPANTIIIHTGEPLLITSGWAGWMRYGHGGRRQIFLFLMPGDFIVPGLFQLECCDLVSLTPLRTVSATSLVQSPATQAAAMISDSVRYYRLLLLDHLTRLTAGCTSRSVAHLLTEFHARSVRSGACIDGRFSLPIGQRVLASALGRSTVQVNKIMSRLHDQGLLEVGYDWIQLRDPEKLRAMAGLTHSVLGTSRPTASLAALHQPAVC